MLQSKSVCATSYASSTNSTPFRYKPLGSRQPEIRLIKLKAADAARDPVHLELFHDNLSNPTEYSALSYTWGAPYVGLPSEWDDSSCKVRILVNGQEFYVRKNLESALRHFRSAREGHRAFWIDAVSINQSDDEECRTGVLQMKQIYEKSQGAIVWLGPAHALTAVAFSKINAVSESWEAQSTGCQTRPLDEDNIAEYREVLLEEFIDTRSIQLWEAIVWFFNCFWWHRVWVVQEVMVAPSTVIVCGQYSLWFHEIMNVWRTLSQHVNSMDGVAAFSRHSKEHLVLKEAYWGARHAAEIGRLLVEHEHKAASVFNLLDVLPILRARGCSDPRDKIYAAIGLANEGAIISPDYASSVDETYVLAARQLITRKQDLNVLLYCEPAGPGSNLPSWTPDWQRRQVCPRRPLAQQFLGLRNHTLGNFYNASGGRALGVDFANHSRTLLLQAIWVANISFVGEPTMPSLPSSVTEPNSLPRDDWYYASEARKAAESDHLNRGKISEYGWLDDWFVWQCNASADCSTLLAENESWQYSSEASALQFDQIIYGPTITDLSNDTFRHAFLRSVCADVRLTDTYHFNGRMGPENDEMMPSASQYFAAVSRVLLGRTFMASATGLMCLGPSETQPNDAIFVVLGSDVPFILRPIENGDFTFVGECYVHGIMDGELFKTGPDPHVIQVRVV